MTRKQQLLLVADTICGLHEVPEGVLYAQTMMYFESLAPFTAIIQSLIHAKLVTRKNHLLTWIGPGFTS